MTDINSITQTGRLVRNAELKYIEGGTAISKFSIAVNRSVKKGDTWTDEVSFFDCVLWGKRAEGLQQYLVKGTRIAIQGEPIQQRWQDADGKGRSKIEIRCDQIVLLDGSKPNTESAETAVTGQQVPAGDGFMDDIPFN